MTSSYSCATLHNETINIYTHFLGAIVFTLLPLWLYKTIYYQTRSAGQPTLPSSHFTLAEL